MKNYFFYIFISFVSISYSQEYRWTGDANNDFFNELNWKETDTQENPPENSINPLNPIDFSLLLTCNIEAIGEIILSENGNLIAENGDFDLEKISGLGEIILNESSYLNLSDLYPISEGITISMNSNKSWIKLYNVDPMSANYYYFDNILHENEQLSYPEEIRYDNYYNDGCIIRLNNYESSGLSIFQENNLEGEFANITTDIVFTGESIPHNLNNNISSFKLHKGFTVTFAENEDGSGNSKTFIASEEDIIVEGLSEYLNNKISFIRVVPWNWVTKKGTAGDTQLMNNNWFYMWSNNGSSDIYREYVPMAWGKAAADDDNDIEIIKEKYKSTHLLAFNEPDDCNGQSGQYANMCQVETALNYYKNLLKSGLRMVSPSCRQGAVFNWLNDFHSSSIDQKIRIDVIAVHWYDWDGNPQNSPNANPQNVFNRFRNYLESVHAMYGLPIWITEFNANRHRNEWVHRQFLQLAMPYLEETEFIERYSFFPPVTGVADFLDANNNFSQIGEFYHSFESSESMIYEKYASPNNLNSNEFEFSTAECDPENTFLSVDEFSLISNPLVFPNPAENILNIDFENDIMSLQIFSIDGRSLKKLNPSKNIDISFLKDGLYFLKVNNHFIKFLKR